MPFFVLPSNLNVLQHVRDDLDVYVTVRRPNPGPSYIKQSTRCFPHLGWGVSGAVRRTCGCIGTRGLLFVGATGSSAATDRLESQTLRAECSERVRCECLRYGQ